MPTITFHDACGVVTGSSTHLDWREHEVLVDCALFQSGVELELRNRKPFPYRPSELTAMVAAHAHLGHTDFPRLSAEGYSGPVYCTKVSRGLISLVLQDAGELQEARYARTPRPPHRRGRTPGP